MPRTAKRILQSRLEDLARPSDLPSRKHGDLVTIDAGTHWVTARFLAAVPKTARCENPICNREYQPLKRSQKFCSVKCKQTKRTILLSRRSVGAVKTC